jgi:hypothetical protein
MIWIPTIGQLVQLRGAGPRNPRDPQADSEPKRKPVYAALEGFMLRSEMYVLAEGEEDVVMARLILIADQSVTAVNLDMIVPVQVGNSPVLGSN